MGEVYLARDDRLGRQVALKFLPLDLASDPGRLRRFEHEARAASALNHPNVATIYEIGDADGRRFIAMEYVAGETLAARIARHPLELTDVLEVALQIAAALEEAHGKAIIHRDINPANVMLTPHGRVKVLDFGLAKVRSAEQDQRPGTVTATTPGLVMGTAQYMSPEQARGEEVDHRSDIFSFGAVLYEMATGRAAFKGPSQAETMNAVINVPHTPAREVRKDVPPQLAAVIDRALMKEARSRYQSMTELLGELRRVAVSLSETGRGVPDLRPGRLTSRLWPVRPSTRLLASAVLVMLVAGVVYAVMSAHRETQCGSTAPATSPYAVDVRRGPPRRTHLVAGRALHCLQLGQERELRHLGAARWRGRRGAGDEIPSARVAAGLVAGRQPDRVSFRA